MELIDKQQELANLMSDISEECYCAGWMDELEFELWSMLENGQLQNGMYCLNPDDAKTLKQLSDDIGGWIVFERRCRFIDRENWLVRYQAWWDEKLEARKRFAYEGRPFSADDCLAIYKALMGFDPSEKSMMDSFGCLGTEEQRSMQWRCYIRVHLEQEGYLSDAISSPKHARSEQSTARDVERAVHE